MKSNAIWYYKNHKAIFMILHELNEFLKKHTLVNLAHLIS